METVSWNEFNSASYSSDTIVELRNENFVNGTVRLRKPATYVLAEDIVFEPNKNDNWFPTKKQTSGGVDAEYPIAPFGPYSLGFFAAITVEGDNITLDLNGKTLRQSNVFNIQQRFFACIEMASSPFIPKQGPGNFGFSVTSASNSFVGNGYLGLSSHHGIHGNGMSRSLIQNLVISNFEVAGISLHGSKDSIVRNITICNQSTQIPILSTYSTARFLPQFLKQIIKDQNDPVIEFSDGRSRSGTDILTALDADANTVLEDVKNQRKVSSKLFANKTGLYDGNGYGVVLGGLGVVVGAFPEVRETEGNENIVLHDIRVENLKTGSGELLGINSVPDVEKIKNTAAYGKSFIVGPVGESLLVSQIQYDNGLYKGNVITDAEFYIAKFGKSVKQLGTTNIPPELVAWAEKGNTKSLDQIVKECNKYYLSGGDSMGHVMKGTIGYFFAQTKNVRSWSLTLDECENKAPFGILNKKESGSFPGIRPLREVFQGSSTRGVVLAACVDTFLKDVKINSVSARGGLACGIDMIGLCDSIRCRSGIEVSKIRAAALGYSKGLPNPHPVNAFTLISKESKEIEL